MLQSINQLYGKPLGAVEGDVGRVKDFYFDDQTWVVRYLVADTGSWLPGRQVLIAPRSLGQPDLTGAHLVVNLSRKQIEESPLIETHKPVSRQYEEEYYRYFGWPGYWQGGGLLGSDGLPSLEVPATPGAGMPLAADGRLAVRADAHLRSTQAVKGYHLQASDGVFGHVSDFMIEPGSWTITRLVIRTGHRFSGKEIQISTEAVERISYEDSTVFVGLSKEAVEQRPMHVPSSEVAVL